MQKSKNSIEKQRKFSHNSSSLPRRDFLKGSVLAAAAGGTIGVLEESAIAAPEVSPAGKGKIKIGVNMEFVRHADKSLAYGIKSAAKIGFQYIEPCFLMGRCLISNGGYCHVTSLDTDPEEIKKMVSDAGVKISAVSSHSDLLNPEFGVLYARRGIRYARRSAPISFRSPKTCIRRNG